MDETGEPGAGGAADTGADADRRADRIAILVVFGALILMAVHFVSGWTFDF